jgi:hypothetical protein
LFGPEAVSAEMRAANEKLREAAAAGGPDWWTAAADARIDAFLRRAVS